MESVPLMWGPVTASPVGIEPMTIFGGGALIIDIQYITARIPCVLGRAARLLILKEPPVVTLIRTDTSPVKQ